MIVSGEAEFRTKAQAEVEEWSSSGVLGGVGGGLVGLPDNDMFSRTISRHVQVQVQVEVEVEVDPAVS